MSDYLHYQCSRARQQANRVSSMLALVETALRLEDKFQDQRVDRPIKAADDPFIPTIGEMIDTLIICQETLQELWEELGRKEP